MTNRNLRPTALAVFSMLGVANAFALVLEAPRSAATLGSAVEFNLRATLSPGEDASTLCLKAEILQADALVSPSKVKIQLIPGTASSSQAIVRITSSVVVEEPVVNLTVSTGCNLVSTRKFVILADPPVAAAAAAQTQSGAMTPLAIRDLRDSRDLRDAPPASSNGRNNSDPRSANAANDAANSSGAGRRAPLNNAIRIPPITRTAPTRSASGGGNALIQSQRLGQERPRDSSARLQLDAVDLAADPVVRLKSSAEITTLPLENSPDRAQAAALWRVLGATTDDLRLDLQRLKAIQDETLALKNASTQMRAENTRLSAQLKDAEDRSYKNPVVYFLGALVFLLLAVAAWLRFRIVSTNPAATWWSQSREKTDPVHIAKADAVKHPSFAHSTAQRKPVMPSAVKSAPKAAGSNEPESAFKGPSTQPLESVLGTLGYESNPRDVNVEELFDIQQQAEFFISLGQHDQAIEVLNNHISENAHTSPLVYLDLLSLYHSRDRNTDYSDLAVEFTRLFNGVVPDFNAFQDKTLGLEAYVSLLKKIVELWHTKNVIAVIEDALFRSDVVTAETLDLEAYRELLLLHTVAKDITENSPEGVALSFPQDMQHTVLDGINSHASVVAMIPAFTPTIPYVAVPKLPEADDETSAETRSNFFQKPVGARIGLDIDLSIFNTPTSTQTLVAPSVAPSVSLLDTQDTVGPSQNDGLIEFDLDAFDAEIGKLSLKGKE